MAEFFGLIVKAGEVQNYSIPEQFVLTLSHAAYVGKQGQKATLYAGVDRKYVLATFREGQTEQVSLDVTFFAGTPLSFGVEGAGEVHLVGSQQFFGDEGDESGDSDELENGKPAGLDTDSEDDDIGDFIDDEAEEDDDDEEDEEDDEDDEEDDESEEEQAPPAKKGAVKALEAPKKPAAAAPAAAKPAAATPAKKDEQKPKAATPAAKPAAAAAAAKPATPAAKAATPAAAKQTPKAAEAKKAEAPATPAAAAKAKPATTPAADKKRPATAGGDEQAAKKQKPEAKSPAAADGKGLKCPDCAKFLPNQQALEQHGKAKHSK